MIYFKAVLISSNHYYIRFNVYFVVTEVLIKEAAAALASWSLYLQR